MKHRTVHAAPAQYDFVSNAKCQSQNPICFSESCPRHNSDLYPIVAKHRQRASA